MKWQGAEELKGLLLPISGLNFDPKNARRHSKRNLEAIMASLKQFGQLKPIVALASGIVIAGNGTMAAARELGWDHLAVVKFQDAEKARAYAIADNRTAELASWDLEELIRALSEVDASGADVGFTRQEISKLLKFSEGDAGEAIGGLKASDGPEFSQMTFILTGRQKAVVEKAIKKALDKVAPAQEADNKNSNGNALEEICRRFLDAQG